MSHDIIENRKFYIARQFIDLRNFALTGRILDIGGGGEGIIGQLFPENTVAIDPRENELAEAASGPLKVVMDATRLMFLPESFDAATLFYTLLFIDPALHENVVSEAARVLKPRGRFLIWDVNIPEFVGGERDIFCFPIEVMLPQKNVKTGFGTGWRRQQRQNQKTLSVLLEKSGFVQHQEVRVSEHSFFLEYVKA